VHISLFLFLFLFLSAYTFSWYSQWLLLLLVSKIIVMKS
jgi:hypothetical protein